MQETLKDNSVNYECPIVYKNGRYRLGKSETGPIRGKLSMNLKMNLILFFRYGGNHRSIENWNKLNQIRNAKAGHSGSDSLVERDDLFLIFEFIQFILDCKNIDDKHKNESLKVSLEDKKKALLERFNSKK